MKILQQLPIGKHELPTGNNNLPRCEFIVECFGKVSMYVRLPLMMAAMPQSRVWFIA